MPLLSYAAIIIRFALQHSICHYAFFNGQLHPVTSTIVCGSVGTRLSWLAVVIRWPAGVCRCSCRFYSSRCAACQPVSVTFYFEFFPHLPCDLFVLMCVWLAIHFHHPPPPCYNFRLKCYDITATILLAFGRRLRPVLPSVALGVTQFRCGPGNFSRFLNVFFCVCAWGVWKVLEVFYLAYQSCAIVVFVGGNSLLKLLSPQIVKIWTWTNRRHRSVISPYYPVDIYGFVGRLVGTSFPGASSSH